MSRTTAGTFRHLGDYRIVGTPRGPWTVVDRSGATVAGPYKVFRNAWQKRKALIAGTTVARAKGLPS